MKNVIALTAAAVLLTSCTSMGSNCIKKSEAGNQPFKFSSTELADAYASIPNYLNTNTKYESDDIALAKATKALNEFNMTTKEETRFLKKRLTIYERLLDKAGARADIERMEELGTLFDNEAKFRLTKVERLGTTPNAQNDRDAQPLIRIPPIMSRAALRGNKSGHCVLEFDVAEYGVPENIRVGYCTDEAFRESSVRSLAKWKYNPAIRNGVAVQRKNVETNIRYIIQDACGNQLPE